MRVRDKELHYKLVKDIRTNGAIYIRNRLTVEALMEIEPRFKAAYDKEENMYHVTYEKLMPDVVYKRQN